MYTYEEAKQIRKKFWILFGERCEIMPELKNRKKKWMLYDTGVKGIDLKFDVNRTHASVILEVNSASEKRRLQIYEALEKYKLILEDGFDEKLVWDFCYIREKGEEVCRIYFIQEGMDIHNQNQWTDIYNFFIRNMLTFENNFLSIRDILKEIL